MNIKTESQFDLSGYVRMAFAMVYQNWAVKVMTLLGVPIGVLLLLIFFSNPSSLDSPPYLMLVFPVFILAFPLLVYYGARKNFKTNARLKERMSYEFTNEGLRITGQSFESNLSWDGVHRLVEAKKWILVYESASLAIPIPKSAFTPDQLSEFKEFLKSQDGIKTKLL